MKQELRSRPNPRKPKTVLRLPDLEHAKAAVLNSLNSADARRGYRHAIDGLVEWYFAEAHTKTEVTEGSSFGRAQRARSIKRREAKARTRSAPCRARPTSPVSAAAQWPQVPTRDPGRSTTVQSEN
jgi:hypothetical protein